MTKRFVFDITYDPNDHSDWVLSRLQEIARRLYSVGVEVVITVEPLEEVGDGIKDQE